MNVSDEDQGQGLKAWVKLNWSDHGFLRVLWTHLYQIAPDVWRSNQPGPRRIEAYANMGFKSVLRLRAPKRDSIFLMEERACAAHGLTLHNVQISGGLLTDTKNLLTLLDTFKIIEKPFVMHCKSGIDRTGLAAFLYLLAETDTPPEIARQQLSFKYLHVKATRHGILDHMADSYLAAYRESGIDLRSWIETLYDKPALTSAYQESKRGT
ncbi:MAG: tyrosine-protein phosphatase [Paracoccaceae bacterium]|nr:tyrosine-protein phosphatase [Paracoccaceae bacterium]